MKKLKHPNSGFSLMEVAIALIVIGLIASFAMGGKELIRTARLRSVNDQVAIFKLATQTFVEKYGCLPGDASNATEMIGENVENGSGNGKISSVEDSKRFWQHLITSGLLKTKLSNGLPQSKLGGCYAVSNCIKDCPGVWVILGETSDNETFDGILSPEDASFIDGENDTGDPTTGEIRSFKGASASGECFNGNKYNLKNKNKDCVIMFQIFE